MSGQLHRRAALAGGAIIAVLLLPPVRQLLEGTMTAQMLLQVPLLACCGLLLARAVPARVLAAIGPWNQGGVSALMLATVASTYWMLPRALDAAATDPLVATAKFASLPLLVGLPLALAWPRMGFILKGVFLLEALATLFRLGWLYLASPQRLCNNYLIDDQQLLGRSLLALGVLLTLWLAGVLLWGQPRLAAEHGN